MRLNHLFHLLIAIVLCSATENASSLAKTIVDQLYNSMILDNPKSVRPIVDKPMEFFQVDDAAYGLLAEPLLWAYLDHPEELNLTAKTEACLNKTVSKNSALNGIIPNCADLMVGGDYGESATIDCARRLAALSSFCDQSDIDDLPVPWLMCPVDARVFGHRLEVVRFEDGRRVVAIQTGCHVPMECSGMTCYTTATVPPSICSDWDWKLLLMLTLIVLGCIGGIIALWRKCHDHAHPSEVAEDITVQQSTDQQETTQKPQPLAPHPVLMQYWIRLPNAVENPPVYDSINPSNKEYNLSEAKKPKFVCGRARYT